MRGRSDCDDRGNEKETQKEKDTGIEGKGRRSKWNDEKFSERERGGKECRRSSVFFIKTIIVQELSIPPGARVHVETHIIN